MSEPNLTRLAGTSTLLHPRHQIPLSPEDIPSLVAFWDFQERNDDRWHPALGEDYPLRERAGRMSTATDPGAPFGPHALQVAEGEWLSIPRAECPRLDIHGPSGQVTVVAWVRRARTSHGSCEFLAGLWNETERSRQYGLFLNISVWQETDQVTGHLSANGGPTPGYRYCMDGPVGSTPIDDAWHCVAMSYDGTQGWVWVDGHLDVRPGLNPYLLPGGLHDGGPEGSDFTVAAVDRSGVIGNFFTGLIGGIAVYDRALGTAEMLALARSSS